LPGLTQETPQNLGNCNSTSWFLSDNRINTWGYDPAGNITSISGMNRGFAYDGENRQKTATINSVVSEYSYDGEGRRVKAVTPSGTSTFVYDAFGNLAAEYSNQAAPPSPCGTQTCYLTVDHLGSTRLLTDSAGSSSTLKRYDYLPFGEELLAGVNGRSTAQGYLASPDMLFEKFTGQVRDTESGIDWMHARFYSGAQGRFQSADPANAGASALVPQSWNAYAYVGNNPMTYTDPSGESWLTWVGLGLAAAATFFTSGAASPLLGISLGTAKTVGTVLLTAGSLASGGTAGAGINALINANNQGAWSERLPTGGALSDPTVIRNLEHTDVGQASLEAFLAGIADSFTFGWTRSTRVSRGLEEPDYCGSAYSAGAYAPLALGAGRAAYAGAAKAIPAVVRAGSTPIGRSLGMSAVRNELKQIFRLGFGGSFRLYTEERIVAKYSGDAATIAYKATKTSTPLNAAGAALGASSATQIIAGCRGQRR
jgi:RHS repeat-associated protein